MLYVYKKESTHDFTCIPQVSLRHTISLNSPSSSQTAATDDAETEPLLGVNGADNIRYDRGLVASTSLSVETGFKMLVPILDSLDAGEYYLSFQQSLCAEPFNAVCIIKDTQSCLKIASVAPSPDLAELHEVCELIALRSFGKKDYYIPKKEAAISKSKLTEYTLKALSAVMAFAATLKAYAGIGAFGREQLPAIPPVAIDTIAALLSVPSFAFGYKSADKVTSKAHSFALRGKLHGKEFHVYKTAFLDALSRAIPKLTAAHKNNWYEYITWKLLMKSILGVGYGAANFGMVYNSFPHTFDEEGLKEFLLAGVFFTNFMVGFDKMDTVVFDVEKAFKEKKEFEVYEAQVELLQNVLVFFEQVLKSSTIDELAKQLYRQEVATALDSWLSTQRLELTLTAIYNAVEQLQRNIEENERTIASAQSLYEPESARNEDALERPFYYAVLIPGQHPWAEKGLSVLSVTFSLLAVTSNVGAIASFSLLYYFSTPIRILIGLLGASGAYSLNKGVIDSWIERALTTFSDKVIRIYSEQTTPGKLKQRYNPFADWNKFTIAGMLWAAFASTANIYFTGEGIKHIMSEGLARKFLSYCAQGACGVLVTATKGKPTGEFLEKGWQKVWCKKDITLVRNKQVRNFYDLASTLLLKSYVKQMELYNIYTNRISEARQARFETYSIDIAVHINDLNQHLATAGSREVVYNQLLKTYNDFQHKILKAYVAQSKEADISNNITVPSQAQSTLSDRTNGFVDDDGSGDEMATCLMP